MARACRAVIWAAVTPSAVMEAGTCVVMVLLPAGAGVLRCYFLIASAMAGTTFSTDRPMT